MKNVLRVLILLLLPGAAQAQLGPSCTLLATPGINFGAYTSGGGALDGQTTLQFSCVPNLLIGPTVSYSISLNQGAGSGGSFNPRRFSGSGATLDYNLYTDPVRITIWGDGTPGTSKPGGTCAGSCSVPVYGRIFAGQSVPAAQYQDDILVTIEF